MSWSIGYDRNWGRDIGYGVPCWCDYPGCNEVIDRGLAFVCGGEPYGGEKGCGLYFCEKHHSYEGCLCDPCRNGYLPFQPKPDHPDWIKWKLTDESWKKWRDENPEEVGRLQTSI